ncbi:MAG: smalltalk protein [Prevotellaceae bacterium]|nr:smalltalk protein [Prevotellaceae bacterium]MDD6895768.1 smalltalk protein [Prevotellaceae bacterium]
MSTPIKKETWKLIVQLIVSIATAIATTLGVTSCMGANVYF